METPTAPDAGEGARAERPLVRAWVCLALLLVLAAPLSAPYQAALASQSPDFRLHERALHSMLVLTAQALLFGWPLAWFGLKLARPLGWGAPFLAGARPWREAARPLAGALLIGLIVGVGLSVAAVGVPRMYPAAFAAAPARLPGPAPWMGAISGVGAGVTEEVWMRLFLMSALARLLGGWTRAAGPPSGAVAWSANAIAALAFGAMHFSNVIVLGLPMSAVNLGLVLFLNGVLGLTCGELFRRQGIEAAILAHFAVAFVGHGVLPALQRIL